MRLHLLLSEPICTVPYNYREFLTGCIHKWMGKNKVHDEISLYSFSNLENGKKNNDGLIFQGNVTWFISAYDDNIIKTLISSIRQTPEVCFGMAVKEVLIQETPDLTNIEYFRIASPVFIKRHEGEQTTHYSYKNENADKYLTDTVKNKMRKAGIINEDIEIMFDRNYLKAHTSLIQYKNIKNRTNWCPIIMKGTNLAKQFAWNVGVGNSTGIGFGAIH